MHQLTSNPTPPVLLVSISGIIWSDRPRPLIGANASLGRHVLESDKHAGHPTLLRSIPNRRAVAEAQIANLQIAYVVPMPIAQPDPADPRAYLLRHQHQNWWCDEYSFHIAGGAADPLSLCHKLSLIQLLTCSAGVCGII